MLINLENAQKRESSESNLLNKLIQRGTNRAHLSTEEKIQIRVDSKLMSRREVAEKHGVSQGTVETYKFGINKSNESFTKVDSEVIEQADERLAKVKSEALDKLMLALGLLNMDKLQNQKARDLSSIAANLSKVISNTSEKTAMNSAVQVVVYAPTQRSIEDFQVVDIK